MAELKSRHLAVLEKLLIKGEMTVRELKLKSKSNIYEVLRQLVKWGHISRHYIQNVDSLSGRRYIHAYVLTEKGKEYLEGRK